MGSRGWGAAVTIAALCLSGALSARAQQAPAKSVWDGVYTEEQAKRGEEVYRGYCATCHGTALTGGEMAGPLVGPVFTSSWNGIDLGRLFDRIRKSMPDDNPGILTRDQAADALAFVLSSNKFPAGQTELARQTEMLTPIAFLANRP